MTDLWDAPADETEGRLARPQDLPAERIVLGSIMQRPDLIDELADVIDPVDFTFDQHAWVWYAIDELRTEMVVPSGGISPFAVDVKLQAWRASGRMPCVPLDAIRLSMIYDEGAGQPAEHFAARVASLAEANRFIDLGMRATQLGMSANFDRDTALADAQAALDAVVRDTEHSVPTRISDLVPAVFKRAVTPPDLSNRIPTGIRDLDQLTGGFAPRKLIIVGARPGVGKTTLANTFVRASAIDKQIPTLFVSLEMGEEELGLCICAAEATVPLHNLDKGQCSAGEMRKLEAVRERLEQAPLYIDDTPHVTLAHLRNRIRTLIRTVGLRYVVVDYLQLAQAPKAENRQVAVSQLSRNLKLMAKEFDIPIVVLAQLNRGNEQRTDKRPVIADLRESGSIEQDADIVILLHRPDMYEPESARAGECDLIVDKHRGGARTTITVAAQMHYARLVDMAADFTREAA
ncbi:DnaB-like helicase C-terminal domain-containing protein [Streptomyces hygroscopicus]|uniref:DnaB-like helicase C-terminal domain-containing protein n=1 Tax=Streptomyces hygroscopicus TaxID=1912 RepID=UPI00381E586A